MTTTINLARQTDAPRNFHLEQTRQPDGSVVITAQGQPTMTATGKTPEEALRNFTNLARDKQLSNTENLQTRF